MKTPNTSVIVYLNLKDGGKRPSMFKPALPVPIT